MAGTGSRTKVRGSNIEEVQFTYDDLSNDFFRRRISEVGQFTLTKG